MRLHSILDRPAARFFFSTPKDEAGGGAKPLTLEEQLTQARNDLTTARASVASLTTARDAALSDTAALQFRFDTLTATATQLRTDLTAAQAQVTTLTGERDTARTQLETANGNVARMEKLCGVKGVDPKAGVPSTEGEETSSLLDTFLRADATARVEMIRKDGAALYAEAKARGIKIG